MKHLLFAALLLATGVKNCGDSKPQDSASQPAQVPGASQVPRSAAQLADSLASQPAPGASTDTVALLSRALWPDLRGYKLASFTKGDINQDRRPDFIAVFRTLAPTDTIDGEASYSRRVALILNKGWPTLALADYNDTVVDCTACGGGGVGDPYQHTAIKGGYFSVESLYGSCQKTYVVTTFRYSKAEHNWFLYKVGQDDDDCRDTTEAPVRHQEQTSRNFGKVSFKDYEGGAPPQTF
jgi:hypothetical protein